MFKDLLDPNWAPIIASFMTIMFGLTTIFFRWLLGSFNKLNASVKELSDTITKWLDDHEELDQLRHEQNLVRFERISVSLARLGSDNGTHKDK